MPKMKFALVLNKQFVLAKIGIWKKTWKKLKKLFYSCSRFNCKANNVRL